MICHTTEELDATYPFWFERAIDTLLYDTGDPSCTEAMLYSYEIDNRAYYTVESPWWPVAGDYDPSDINEAIDAWLRLVGHVRHARCSGPDF